MSGSMLSSEARAAMDAMGSAAGELLLSSAPKRPTRSMVRGTVSAVNDGYTYDVALADGSTMEDVPYTLGAARADVGDSCLVELLSGRAWVTGVVVTSENVVPSGDVETWSSGSLNAWRSYGWVSLSMSGDMTAPPAWGTVQVATLPEGWRPYGSISVPVQVQHYDGSTTIMQVATSGAVKLVNKGGTVVNSGWMWAAVTYPTGEGGA